MAPYEIALARIDGNDYDFLEIDGYVRNMD